MGRLMQFFVCASILFNANMSAYIYDFVVMSKWNGSQYRYFIGLSDFHDKEHKSNKFQVNDINKLISRFSRENLKIGAEDIGSPGITKDGYCGRFFVLSQGGVLNDFVKLCRLQNLNFSNFEYRYCRVASLGPILNNLDKDLKSFSSANSTFVFALIKEVEEILDELNGYKDSKLLKDLYAHSSAKMKNLMKEMNLYQYADMTVADFITKHSTEKNLLSFIKKLLTFDSVLFDLRLLHDILQQENSSNYLAIAGGSHISRVTKFLSKLGYKFVKSARPEFTQERNLDKCLGSHIIDGKYCRRPKPIDLSLVVDFF